MSLGFLRLGLLHLYCRTTTIYMTVKDFLIGLGFCIMIGQKSAADVTTQLALARNYRISKIETSQTEAIYRCHQSANILPP